MNKAIFSLFFLSFVLSCSTSKKIAKGHKQQHTYIPSDFHDTYLGMPLIEFKKVRQNATFRGEEGFRSVYVEKLNEGAIKEVVYYFGTKGDSPLYEYIFDYHSKDKRDAFVSANLKTPNSGEEWRFACKEGFDIRAWTFGKRLVVTGLIKDTEWYDDEMID